MTGYTPHDWFWLVAGDASRAWSSAAGSYVEDWPAERTTRIASEAELNDVLAAYGLRGPLVTANDVRAECARRMRALVGARDDKHLDVIVSNGSREAIRLLRIKSERVWTTEEATRAATLEAVDAAIEALRVASNDLEGADPIPSDFRENEYWA